MPIKIKDLTDLRLQINVSHPDWIGSYDISINFNCGTLRYHIWINNNGNLGPYMLGDTIYGNPMIERRGIQRTSKADTRSAAHAKLINHLLTTLGIATPINYEINQDAITGMIDATKISAAKSAKKRAAFELSEWAGLARERLYALIDTDLDIKIFGPIAITTFANAPDAVLLAVYKALKG